jgi:hypothetical protein
MNPHRSETLKFHSLSSCCLQRLTTNYRADWRSGNALDLHSARTRFESLQGHRVSWLRCFVAFLSPLRKIRRQDLDCGLLCCDVPLCGSFFVHFLSIPSYWLGPGSFIYRNIFGSHDHPPCACITTPIHELIHFHPTDWGGMFLRNVVIRPRPQSSQAPPWNPKDLGFNLKLLCLEPNEVVRQNHRRRYLLLWTLSTVHCAPNHELQTSS